MQEVATTAGRPPRLWVSGNWNAFFGFGTNILVNIFVLTGLLRFVLKMPDELVFERILPATGLMLFLSTVSDRRLRLPRRRRHALRLRQYAYVTPAEPSASHEHGALVAQPAE